MFHLAFTWNIFGKKITITFLGAFFVHPYLSNGTKLHLDVVLTVYLLLFYLVNILSIFLGFHNFHYPLQGLLNILSLPGQ